MLNGGTQFCFIDPVIDDEKTILDIRRSAMRQYREGKTIMSWTGEGVSSERQFSAPVESILAETRRALKLINPTKYGYIVRQSYMYRYG